MGFTITLFMKLVIRLVFGALISIYPEENAEGHDCEFNVTANKSTVVQPSVAISSSRDDFITKIKVPIFYNIWRFSFYILAKAIHTVCVECLMLSPVAFVFEKLLRLDKRWDEVNKPTIFQNDFAECKGYAFVIDIVPWNMG